MIVFSKRAFSLTPSNRRAVLAPVDIPLLTSSVSIVISRPMTLSPQNWGNADTISISGFLELDGTEEHRFAGRATGGIRINARGDEIPAYQLKFSPTFGFFGAREGKAIRLGERSKSFYRLRLEIERLSGRIESDIEVILGELAAPDWTFRSSVAFDAATDGNEIGGDGVLSITHTSTGSDRGVMAGNGNSSGATGQPTTSITYPGATMTEQSDQFNGTFKRGAMYTGAGQNTGAQSVTSTLADVTDEHGLGVISMTGVDQTTPVGTVAQAVGLGTSATTVTVGSVGTDDLVVDNLYTDGIDTIGADQTERYIEGPFYASVLWLRGSTQPGTAGGVMSHGNCDQWCLAAIAFKPAAAAASTYPGWQSSKGGWW